MYSSQQSPPLSLLRKEGAAVGEVFVPFHRGIDAVFCYSTQPGEAYPQTQAGGTTAPF